MKVTKPNDQIIQMLLLGHTVVFLLNLNET